jgi:hypothetical protein
LELLEVSLHSSALFAFKVIVANATRVGRRCLATTRSLWSSTRCRCSEFSSVNRTDAGVETDVAETLVQEGWKAWIEGWRVKAVTQQMSSLLRSSNECGCGQCFSDGSVPAMLLERLVPASLSLFMHHSLSSDHMRVCDDDYAGERWK